MISIPKPASLWATPRTFEGVDLVSDIGAKAATTVERAY